MTNTTNTLLVGTGKLGQRLFSHLNDAGHHVITLSRHPKPWSPRHLCVNLSQANLSLSTLPALSQVFIMLAPAQRNEQAYRDTYVTAVSHLLSALHQQQQAFHCVFVSSTSVYAGNSETVITEATTPKPASFSGEVMLEAEQSLRQHHPNSSIVRASGLYSEQRQRLLHSLTDPDKQDDPKWLNLIHEDDLCRLLLHTAEEQWPLLLASDGAAFQRRHLQEFLRTGKAPNIQPERLYQSIHADVWSLTHPSIFSVWASLEAH